MTVIKITEKEYRAHCNAMDGVCLACKEFTTGGVEPDAENYECPMCGENEVFGTEQALMLEELDIIDEP